MECKKYLPSLLFFLLFEIIAFTLYLTTNNLFYLINFTYIGSCLALGTVLSTAGKKYARKYYPNKKFSDFKFVVCKRCNTEKEAYILEKEIVEKYNLFTS